MKKGATPKLVDAGAERALIAGLMKHGPVGLAEIEELVSTGDFYYVFNQHLFSILRHLVLDKQVSEFDVPTVLAGATAMGHMDFIGRGREREYLLSLTLEEVGLANMRTLALHVAKLSIARSGYLILRRTSDEMLTITGDEPVSEILSRMEDPILDFASKLGRSDEAITGMGQGAQENLAAWAANPKDVVGLPTGFVNWDHAVGGGQRPGSVNVLGARPKNGKSMFCLNVARTVASAGIPVLYIDTELTRIYQQQRLLSLSSGIDLNLIETGQFGAVPEASEAVTSMAKHVQGLPLDHCNIAGQPIESALGRCRHWLMKRVGLNSDGTARPCLIIYDYLKLMNSADIKAHLAEYQLLGFLLTEMHNFALRYMVPILATVQLNRDGVEQEGSNVFAGSDRILWLCSSATILKRKSPNELDEDPVENGDRKLVVTDTRFGGGLAPGDYINVISNLPQCRFTEGKTFSQELAGLPTNPQKGVE